MKQQNKRWIFIILGVLALLVVLFFIFKPKIANHYHQKAITYIDSGAYQKAIEQSNKALILQQSPPLYTYRAKAFILLEKYPKALKDCKKAIKLDSSYGLAWYYRGKAYYHQQNYKEAIRHLTEAQSKEIRKKDLFHQLGMSYKATNAPQKSLNAFDKALELDSSYGEAYFQKGIILTQLKKWEPAIKNINQALHNNVDSVRGLQRRVALHDSINDTSGSIKDYSLLIKLGQKNEQNFYQRGYLLFSLNKYHPAIKDFRKVIDKNPQKVDAYYYKGYALGKTGQYQASINDFNKVLELDPERTKAYYNRGLSRMQLKHYRQAIQDFKKVTQQNPQHAKAFNMLGIAHSSLNDHQSAIPFFNKAIAIKSKFTDAYYHRGISRGMLKNHKEAIEDYSKALEIQSNRPAIYFNRGISKINLNKFTAGCKDLRKADQMGFKKAKKMIKMYCK